MPLCERADHRNMGEERNKGQRGAIPGIREGQ